MTQNPNRPQEDDAVLGGNVPAYSGLVLGGMEGVKRRFATGSDRISSIDQRIATLNDALKYGQAGLDFLIHALDDESWPIHQAAASLLNTYYSEKVKKALQRYSKRLAQELIKRYEAGERNFQGANLSGLYLPWAVLNEANLSQTNLSEAYLNRAYLSGADLSNANLKQANLTGGELSEANLNHANLTQAYLNQAALNQATLIGTNLREVDLSSADLSKSNLSEATLCWANLSETSFRGANLTHANLVGAKFTSLDLSGADLSGAKLNGVNLEQANLEGAYYNEATDWPVGFRAYSKLIKR